MNASLENVEEYWDDRKTVLVNMMFLLLKAFQLANNKFVGGLYVESFKKFGTQKKKEDLKIALNLFNPKQIVKILKEKSQNCMIPWKSVRKKMHTRTGSIGYCHVTSADHVE